MEKKNYAFIDAIRCIAMISIVFEHCVWVGDLTHTGEGINLGYSLMIQVAKFGTICFFLIAGFLIGDKLFTYTPAEYFKRRIATVAKPWFLWTMIFLGLLLLDELARYFRYGSDRMTTHFAETMRTHLALIFIYSPFWFILNFLICIGILLLFRKYLYAIGFGFILMCFTLFYVVNIYFEWIPPSHTTALFGFIFFLWLGAQFFRHWTIIEAWIRKVPVWLYLLIIVITLGLGAAEITYLRNTGSSSPYNSLRISNILFSFAVFFFLIKIKDYRFVDILRPRETTFGIYLVHFLLIYNGLPLITRPLKIHPENFTLLPLIGYQLLSFVLIYFLSILLVRLLNNSRYKWLIGR